MICRLEIKNYAIIESLEIDLSGNLNIITGETGSGKSILIGALSLILGKRADTKVLLDPAKKCIVEGVFTVGNYDLQSFFSEYNLDFEEEIIIRREITAAGKGRAFINDTPVKLNILKRLSSQLVDLHQQFENLGLNNRNQQIVMLDAFAGTRDLSDRYKEKYKKYLADEAILNALEKKQRDAIKQRDYLQYQLDELNEVDIQIEKDNDLESKLNELEHASEISSVLNNLAAELEERDSSVVNRLQELRNELQSIVSFHKQMPLIIERINQTHVELADIARDSKNIAENVELDPNLTQQIRERVDLINGLLHKHQASDVDHLAAIRENIEKELDDFLDLDTEIEEKKKEIEITDGELKKIGGDLSRKRIKCIPSLETNVNDLLATLKMENAKFKVECLPSDHILATGLDDISFLFAPNKGSKFFEIKEVASGGEMSRLSLIIKSLVAGSVEMPTLVFDEIDSGVSGDIATKMGEILKKLAVRHQVISITHSPQVAAKASKHFTVYKETDQKATRTVIKELGPRERIVEIATMLSSQPPSKAAITSAKELMS